MNSDNEFLTIIRSHERVVAAVLAALLLFCTGITTVLYYAYRADIEQREIKNKRASDYVSSLYREAETASKAVDPLAEQPCTVETQRRMRHIVAINPHIRSVNVYSKDRDSCSSLEGSLSATDISRSLRFAPFYTTMKQEEGYIFYMVYFSSPSHLIGVAVNGYFVRDALRYISPDAAFYPLQDFMNLNPHGYIWKNSKYPFVLVSSYSMNFRTLLFQSRLIIAFIIVVSLLVGWLTYLSTGLMNTPRFALKYYLRKKRFYPVYQPVISTRDNKVAGLEILMRCVSKTGREASPAMFIPLAEQSGMIRELTLQLLTKVRDDLTLFADKGLYLAVNITSDLIECPESHSELLKFTQQARQSNLAVMAEITERQSFCLTTELSEKLARLREAGLGIAIDDFGTGYSNLSSINQLNPDYLKIDKDFTGYSQVGGVKEALLGGVLHISRTTGVPLIAEGIETPAQFQYMRDRGVWLFQGYLFCRPCDAISACEYIFRFGRTA